MKSKFIYWLLLLPVFITGCAKTYNDPETDPNKWSYPLGTFNGKFMRIHKNQATLKYDTTTAMLKLVLSTNTGFAISGDTAMVHAGSYGSFSEDFVNMNFSDITSPINYTPKKTHLSGYYTYTYDGSYLVIVNGVKSDTLSCVYHFTKMK
jgi:hypothetical protein